MGRIDKNDARYLLLARVPRNQDGRVVFRKKRSHARAYMLCVLELDDAVVTVLYKMNTKTADEAGNPCTSVSFDAA